MILKSVPMAVTGKGDEKRLVPVSIELRRHLFTVQKTTKTEFVFMTKTGGNLVYNSRGANLLVLIEKLVEGGFGDSFHPSRRCFAGNFIRNGVIHLSCKD